MGLTFFRVRQYKVRWDLDKTDDCNKRIMLHKWILCCSTRVYIINLWCFSDSCNGCPLIIIPLDKCNKMLMMQFFHLWCCSDSCNGCPGMHYLIIIPLDKCNNNVNDAVLSLVWFNLPAGLQAVPKTNVPICK